MTSPSTTIQYFFGNAHHPTTAFWDTYGHHHTQNHGTNLIALQHPGQSFDSSQPADIFVTQHANTPVGIRTADCLPILLSQDTTIMAIHAGYLGLQSNILAIGYEHLRRIATKNNAPITAWLGPCIQACCYSVPLLRITNFMKCFPDLDPNLIAPHPTKLNLQGIAEHVLRSYSITTHKIPDCTYCSKSPLYHSFRKTQTSERQFSYIVRMP